jgi:hypothetical protein
MIRAAALQKGFAPSGELVDDGAHDLGVEVLHRLAAVPEPAAGVLVRAARRLHDAVEADELTDDDSRCLLLH